MFFEMDERGEGELSARPALEENLSERSIDDGEPGTIPPPRKEHGAGAVHNADPIWTWNAPEFLTGDFHGTEPDLGNTDGSERPMPPVKQPTFKEKVQNVKDYFASLEEYERRKGGRTHYRIILSFDVPATNQQIRNLTNKFLEQAFPKAIAFAAIHRDTDHPHV
ncbi:MAG: relaxase/mobilization nuclease domain-containing protein, partial [Blastocatellia bacterium]